MERDLRLIRKKRAERDRERDRALGIPSPSSLAKEMNDTAQLNDNMSAGNASAVQNTTQGQESKGGDVLLVADHGEPNALNLQEDSQRKLSEGEVIGTGQGMPQDSENSAGLAITMPSDVTTDARGQPNNASKRPENTPSAPEASSDMLDAADLDFESMFNDTDLVGGDDAMNFEDLGFSMDATMNQDILNNSTLQDTNMSNADMTNLVSTSNEDINSLLPGLENYVNAGTDFSSIGMPATSTQPENSRGAPVANMGTSAPNAAEPVPGDTNFDDFFGVNFEMNATGGDEMGDTTLGDFDDFQWD